MKLDLDRLAVTSFAAEADAAETRGTVLGRSDDTTIGNLPSSLCTRNAYDIHCRESVFGICTANCGGDPITPLRDRSGETGIRTTRPGAADCARPRC